ncbi:MAG: tetratricopeptide repeat protein [Rhodocyclales bacterium]|nr:tetratricopeptide repeat protein [Rhodocyclales bacterium]
MEARLRNGGPWFLLAAGALGLSALFAVALVVARTPLFGLSGGTFRTALVLHVDLAVVVWFLAVAAGVWGMAAGSRSAPALRAAFGMAAAGVAVMLLSPMLMSGPPVLANYMPVLDSAVFLGGLALFAVGVVLAALAGALALPRREAPPWQVTAWLAALVLLLAAGELSFALWRAPAVAGGVPLTLDDRLWAAGHTLQLAHVLLMMGAWTVLGEAALAASPSRRWLRPLLGAAALPALASLWLSIAEPVGSFAHRQGYTELMRWGIWPAAALLGAVLLAGIVRRWRAGTATLEEAGLALSIMLFATGCLVGAGIRGESTAVPAHYHGTVGAVTLAYLLWGGRLVAATALAGGRRRLLLPLAYGLGIVLLVAGLAWWGSLGVPRKATHAEIALGGFSYYAAMGMAGGGGFTALSAVLLFVGDLARRLLLRPRPGGRADVRPLAVALTALVVIGGGWLLNGVDAGAPVTGRPAAAHVAEKKKAEIDARFAQGVVMLHSRQYDFALAAFHRVLELAPEMPEAHVNAGFALLGLKDYGAARDFFESASELRREQANAYYGLAVALEGLHDLPGALGAMRTYLHRAPANDPYRVKAESALWEWQAQLDRQRGGTSR